MNKISTLSNIIIWSSAVTLTACSSTPSNLKVSDTKLVLTVVQNYANLTERMYQDAVVHAKALQSSVKTFTQNPNVQTFKNAKDAWALARQHYSVTEALRFYGGPIDNAETGPEGLLNSWPLDEAYIDYVKGSAKSGIIQNPAAYPTINKELLLSLNEKDGEKNISTGYHAVEFLLWGQDFSTKSAGTRSYKDYDTKSNAFAARRAIYINLLCDLIVEHLEQVAEQWSSKTKNSYREAFLNEPLDKSLQKIFTGITTLSVDEMAGERLTVALEINDQENEQNCFSDLSLEDSAHNQAGISQILKSTLLLELIASSNNSLSSEITKVAENVERLHEEIIRLGPFDKIIANRSEASEGRKKMRELIAALGEQSVAIAKAGKELGLNLNVETKSETAK